MLGRRWGGQSATTAGGRNRQNERGRRHGRNTASLATTQLDRHASLTEEKTNVSNVERSRRSDSGDVMFGAERERSASDVAASSSIVAEKKVTLTSLRYQQPSIPPSLDPSSPRSHRPSLATASSNDHSPDTASWAAVHGRGHDGLWTALVDH